MNKASENGDPEVKHSPPAPSFEKSLNTFEFRHIFLFFWFNRCIVPPTHVQTSRHDGTNALDAEAAPVAAARASLQPQLPADVSVLIVDDLPGELRLLSHFLSDAGALVMVAVDGTQALRLAQQMRPDVVLLDVLLPPPDGFEVCRQLRADPQTASIPVIFVSGLVDIEAKLRGFAAGGQDFITKPFSAAEVLARVALHVDMGRRLGNPNRMRSAPPWLVQAVAWIQAHLDAPLALDELAQQVGVLARKLNEAFRSHLGTSCAAFVRETRLQEAARLLGDPRREVNDIGQTVGYPNAANFSTAFKDRFGVSPRQYRQSRLADSPAVMDEIGRLPSP
jgi:CheY-like chemotaxis protein